MSEIPFGKAPRPSIDFRSTTKDENNQPCCAGCSPDVLLNEDRPDPDIAVLNDGTRYVLLELFSGVQTFSGLSDPQTGSPVNYSLSIESLEIRSSVGSCKQDDADNCVASSPCTFTLTAKIVVMQTRETVGNNGSNLRVPNITLLQFLGISNGAAIFRRMNASIGNGRFQFDDDGTMAGYRWDAFIAFVEEASCSGQKSLDYLDLEVSLAGQLPLKESLKLDVRNPNAMPVTLICTSCFNTSSEV